MALINHAKREINAKIVYYGLEGTGKRDSLQYIYDRIKPSLKGELKVTSSLLFFDFSPFDKPVFGDYRLRFHVYTLPGKVDNPAAWKMTLKGVDGLVIVANTGGDLAAPRENVQQLRGFLTSYGVGLSDIPFVLQLNRLDLDEGISAESVAAHLGLKNVQAVFAVPVRGEGVLGVLSALSREIMARIGRDEALQPAEPIVEQPVSVEDEEVSAALTTLELKPTDAQPEQRLDVSAPMSMQFEEKSVIQRDSVQVGLTAEGAQCRNGVVRIPLEFVIGGETRRLVVSVSLEQEPNG